MVIISVTDNDGELWSMFEVNISGVSPVRRGDLSYVERIVNDALANAGYWQCDDCGEWFNVKPNENSLNFYCDKCFGSVK